MKTLKFSAEQVQKITDGTLRKTWRINDDKDISVDDRIQFVNKKTGESFGQAIIDQVVVKRFSEITKHDTEGVLSLHKYYGKNIDPSLHVKIIDFTFGAYTEPLPPVFAPGNLKRIKLFADGGSRGNPGPSASGYVLLDSEERLVKESGLYLGITTNNQAEYQALKIGLEDAARLGAQEVDVYMDSMLVVNQMKGIFKVKNKELWPVHNAIQDLVQQFRTVTFTHVPRELNKLADAEVNKALDANESHMKRAAH